MSATKPDTVEIGTPAPAAPTPAAAPAPQPVPVVPSYPDMRRTGIDARTMDGFSGDVGRPGRGGLGDFLGQVGTNGRLR